MAYGDPDIVPEPKPWHCPASALGGMQHEGDRYCGFCGAAMFWECNRLHRSPLWAIFCTTCGVARTP